MGKKHSVTFEYKWVRVPCCNGAALRWSGGMGWCVNGRLVHPLMPHAMLPQRQTYAVCKCGKYRASCDWPRPHSMSWDKHVAHPLDERYQRNDA